MFLRRNRCARLVRSHTLFEFSGGAEPPTRCKSELALESRPGNSVFPHWPAGLRIPNAWVGTANSRSDIAMSAPASEFGLCAMILLSLL
jgi:hypothetical protein